MRKPVDSDRVQRLIRALARGSKGPGRVYLVGGTSAVLEGWRSSTVDADLAFDPEPPGIFSAIARIKQELDMNIELANPAQFVPALLGWRDRSPWIATHDGVSFHHYDFYSQAFAKIERGHPRDERDVQAMVESGRVDPAELLRLIEQCWDALERYPSIDPDALRSKVDAFRSRHGA
jgi:hypothetical protein